MDDALLVRGLESRRDLRGVVEGGVERQGPASGVPCTNSMTRQPDSTA